MEAEKTYTIDEAHRYFGIEFNQQVWKRIKKELPTKVDLEEALAYSILSHAHWKMYSGSTLINQQRGHYLIGLCHLLLDDFASAEKEALACKAQTSKTTEGIKDFDFFYAYELLARVYAATKNPLLEETYKQAEFYLHQISDKDDIVWEQQDWNSGPWFGKK